MIRKLLTYTLLCSAVVLSSCKSFPYEDKSYSLEEVAHFAEKQGIHALVHGADHARKMYIVSWSSPSNFFNRHNLVITSEDPEIRKQIYKLNRGDILFIQGPVNMNRGQAHLVIEKFKFKKEYKDGVTHTDGEFSRETKLPGDLLKKKKAIFYVHATSEGGKVLVLEYNDTVVPLIVKNPDLTKDLYRGDYIELAYKIQRSDVGYRATHLLIDESAAEPVKVLDSVVKLHDQDLHLEGRMVMFPKSPTINRNIFAVEVHWNNGQAAPRYYTILPLDFKGDKFQNLLKKMQTAWDEKPDKIYKGRNKYIHTQYRLSIKGKGNVVSENQANPQIFTDIKDLKIIK